MAEGVLVIKKGREKYKAVCDRLLGKDILIVLCLSAQFCDEILIGRKPVDRLQFVGNEPFSSFVFQ